MAVRWNNFIAEREIVPNDPEALFPCTQFVLFRDSGHASREKRNSIVPSMTESERREQNGGSGRKIGRIHSSPLLCTSLLSSLFSRTARGKRIIQLVRRPSKSDYRRFLCTRAHSLDLTVCIDFRRSVYQQLIPKPPKPTLHPRKHSVLSIRRVD